MTSVLDHPSSASLRELSAALSIEPWVDQVVDRLGHDPRSLYVERYWLPVLGPSTTWMLRRFASYLDDSPDGAEVSTEDLAKGLGLGERSGPNAPFARTLRRCVDFQMAEWRGPVLAVRRKLPPLARRHMRRLPPSLQEEHDLQVAAALEGPPLSERLRSQARELALSLVNHGDDRAMAEEQLIRWGFEAVVAAEGAEWAAVRVRTARAAAISGAAEALGG